MKIIWIILLLIIVGCKKNEHPLPNCSLCNYAENIEGIYRGRVDGYNGLLLQNNPNVPDSPTDSMTMTLQHIFMNQDPYTDSTIMFFRTEYWYDLNQIHKFDTIMIKSEDGYFENDAYLEFAPNAKASYSYFKIKDETVRIKGIDYNPYFMNGTYINVYGAILIKQ